MKMQITLVDELQQTYTGRRRLNGDLNKRVAFRILHELMAQKGFIGWFASLHDDLQEEIIERAIDIVCETIDE